MLCVTAYLQIIVDIAAVFSADFQQLHEGDKRLHVGKCENSICFMAIIQTFLGPKTEDICKVVPRSEICG